MLTVKRENHKRKKLILIFEKFAWNIQENQWKKRKRKARKSLLNPSHHATLLSTSNATLFTLSPLLHVSLLRSHINIEKHTENRYRSSILTSFRERKINSQHKQRGELFMFHTSGCFVCLESWPFLSLDIHTRCWPHARSMLFCNVFLDYRPATALISLPMKNWSYAYTRWV